MVHNPCQENWDKMLPQEKGRFCNSCAKTVVDYANMSDREINERMRNATSHMCGRFTQEQIDKTFTIRPKVQLSAQRRFFQYILTFLLGSKAFVNKAIAQDTLKTEQADSLKLTVQADSCITDTIALAQADTLSWKSDSTWVNWEPEVITITTTETIFLGTWIQTPVQIDEFPLLPAAFDSIKRAIGIAPRNKKEITIQEDVIPKKQRPKPPVKKEEPITAVLPTEIKNEWDESKTE